MLRHLKILAINEEQAKLAFEKGKKIIVKTPISACTEVGFIYRLTHSASGLSGFTFTSSLTMNEKFQYRTRPPSAVLKNFEFIVSERVQVNPDNSLAECVNLFIIQIEYTASKNRQILSQPKPWCNDSGV